MSFNLWAIEGNKPSPSAPAKMNTPKNYIAAQSWNRTWFYFNVIEQTWEMADDTVLTMEHDATEEDMVGARIRAKAEGFAADNMQLIAYTEA